MSGVVVAVELLVVALLVVEVAALVWEGDVIVVGAGEGVPIKLLNKARVLGPTAP